MKKLLLVPVIALGAATPAFANYSTLTSAVDFTEVKTALLAVAAVVVGVLILRKGIRFVLGAIR